MRGLLIGAGATAATIIAVALLATHSSDASGTGSGWQEVSRPVGCDVVQYVGPNYDAANQAVLVCKDGRVFQWEYR